MQQEPLGQVLPALLALTLLLLLPGMLVLLLVQQQLVLVLVLVLVLRQQQLLERHVPQQVQSAHSLVQMQTQDSAAP